MTATIGTMSRRTPAPPPHLRDAMSAAWDNPTELRALHAQYLAWLHDHETQPRRWDNQ